MFSDGQVAPEKGIFDPEEAHDPQIEKHCCRLTSILCGIQSALGLLTGPRLNLLFSQVLFFLEDAVNSHHHLESQPTVSFEHQLTIVSLVDAAEMRTLAYNVHTLS